MKNHGFSRFPKVSWEIWVSKVTNPPRCVRAYSIAMEPGFRNKQIAEVGSEIAEVYEAKKQLGLHEPLARAICAGKFANAEIRFGRSAELRASPPKKPT